MTMLRYNIQTGANGSIVIPTTPFAVGEEVEVVLRMPQMDDDALDDDWQVDPARILPNGKTALEDFLDFCKELNLPSLTDEEVEQLRAERLQRKATMQMEIMDQTPEEWQAAVDDFTTSWKGCLKGTPHMTAKEIRAERLEKKYGQRGGTE